MTALIIDTSTILASFDEAYPEHPAIAHILGEAVDLLVVSPFIVAEADYMLSSRLGADAARAFGQDVVTGAYELAEWTAEDHAVAVAITRQFNGPKDYIGIADASNVVLADRYRTTAVVTLDQRHFRQLRPLWGADHFTLLPYDAN
ncbi:PIN domain-containing protein [Nocardia pseudovaccinii]|uniref:PIN domain-containing protein n=1 Tax=Nocardia pseudovaccinii TaxID=189540 RepID=UPI0007A551B5|nr:PIN domain-containing protein [Nocardia pseudovaccinii]